MKLQDKLLKFLMKNGPTTIDQLATQLNVSRQYVHILVKKLQELGKVKKMGNAPHVFYTLVDKISSDYKETIAYEKENFLNQHFLLVDALGNKLSGIEAMKYWCDNQKLPFQKTVDEYIDTRTKYLSFFNQEHLVDGMSKLKNTKGIGEIGVNQLYYLDFYAIERFGKTKLGCLMHYAKQGQNKKLMKEIVYEIRNRLNNFIHNHQIEAVLYVPPTIRRKTQIMDFIEKELQIDLPKILIKKVSNEIVIPQKALSKLFERVANAKNTFVITDQPKYKRILIIDDAVGSGATINEIALKLKSKKIANHITGIALTGSYKGFEVISEL